MADKQSSKRGNAFKHGACSGDRHGTKLYKVWCNAKQRCENSNCEAYKDYGARGIRMCQRWRNSFAAFQEDVGDQPTDKHCLDRKDNNKGYTCGGCPECLENGWERNTRWVTMKEQSSNRRSNVWVEWQGEKRTLKQWAEHLGFPYLALYLRIKRRGWAVDKAFTTPIGG